jgi:hypothetical protein
MKIFAVLILAGFVYGFVRIMVVVIKELALFVIEAWRDIQI